MWHLVPVAGRAVLEFVHCSYQHRRQPFVSAATGAVVAKPIAQGYRRASWASFHVVPFGLVCGLTRRSTRTSRVRGLRPPQRAAG